LDDIIAKVSDDFMLKKKRELNNKINKTGILSLTSTKNNILLWSHYANGHKGSVVGFDSKKLLVAIGDLRLQSFIKEIYYTEYYPEIKFEYNLMQENDESLLFKAIVQSLTTKSEFWCYEDEVRILTFAKNNVIINFPNSTLLK
jgi:hypothetical protein